MNLLFSWMNYLDQPNSNLIARLPFLRVRLEHPMTFRQLPLLRAAVAHYMGGFQAPSIYHHHHRDGSPIFSYPALQYKLANHQPLMLAYGLGIGALEDFLAQMPSHFRLNGDNYPLEISGVSAYFHSFRYWAQPIEHRIYRWLALSQANYCRYQAANPEEQLQLLANILIGNILSAGKALGLKFNQRIEVSDLEVASIQHRYYKKQAFLAFNVKCGLNVNLPDRIGLGKLASVGFGNIRSQPAIQNTIETQKAELSNPLLYFDRRLS